MNENKYNELLKNDVITDRKLNSSENSLQYEFPKIQEGYWKSVDPKSITQLLLKQVRDEISK